VRRYAWISSLQLVYSSLSLAPVPSLLYFLLLVSVSMHTPEAA